MEKFDSIKDSGDSPSTSDRKDINDQEVVDIVQYIDEHTDNDNDFNQSFVTMIYEHFGWKYVTKEEMSYFINNNPDDGSWVGR